MSERVRGVCWVVLLSLVVVIGAAEVPQSKRSREVTERIMPRLNRDLSARGFAYGAEIFLRILKASHELELWLKKGDQFQLFRTYQIHYFSGTLGPKLREGDRQAPEGFYYVPPSRMNPYSRYHLSFNLGYPNRYDRAYGRTGSALMVHGGKVSIGCFAMTDERIEEIYSLADAALRNGQRFFRVHVFPFRMTRENLERHRGSRWDTFWENLREGYDYFERHKNPPNVEVRNRRYIFEAASD